MLSLSQCIMALCVLVTYCTQKEGPTRVISKVKTDKTYVETSLNPKNVYSIDIDRIATNKEDETSKCSAQQK